MASSSSAIDLSGKVYCLITGASRGIGKALAIGVSKIIGADSLLVLISRNEANLVVTASECKASKNLNVKYYPLDLGEDSLTAVEGHIKQSVKGCDLSDFERVVIIHNVGSIGNLDVETDCLEDTKQMHSYYTLNVFNVISMNTKLLKMFKEHEDRVVIVNITSLCAIKPMGGLPYYCSGKAAREMYFKVLAEEKPNIRILNYSPGPVKTEMIEYIIDKAVNEKLREVFSSFTNLLEPEVTATKCIKVLTEGKFVNGAHVDFFDEE